MNKINLDSKIKCEGKKIHHWKSEGKKYMLIRNVDEEVGLNGINPFYIKKVIDSVVGGEVVQAKTLRDGKILVQTANIRQAQRILTLSEMATGLKVEVSPHPKLNSCKGVVFCRDFKHIDDETLEKELADQKVTKVQRMRKNGEETGLFFITFDGENIPEYIACGYMRVNVRPFEEEPSRCFKCLQFGHQKFNCQSKVEVCGNCAKPSHTDRLKKEKCINEMKCVNCTEEGHGSFSKKCIIYKKEKEILSIMEKDKVGIFEAKRRFFEKYPNFSFADAVKQKLTCNESCICCREKKRKLVEPGPGKNGPGPSAQPRLANIRDSAKMEVDTALVQKSSTSEYLDKIIDEIVIPCSGEPSPPSSEDEKNSKPPDPKKSKKAEQDEKKEARKKEKELIREAKLNHLKN